MTRLLAIGAALGAIMFGASAANAETCMVKEQIPVPCAGNYGYAPAPRYAAPVYRPVYRAPVYAAPVYGSYYGDDYYDGYYDDDYYYGGPGYYAAPSVSFGFGFGGDFGGRHHGGHHRWHHRH